MVWRLNCISSRDVSGFHSKIKLLAVYFMFIKSDFFLINDEDWPYKSVKRLLGIYFKLQFFVSCASRLLLEKGFP